LKPLLWTLALVHIGPALCIEAFKARDMVAQYTHAVKLNDEKWKIAQDDATEVTKAVQATRPSPPDAYVQSMLDKLVRHICLEFHARIKFLATNPDLPLQLADKEVNDSGRFMVRRKTLARNLRKIAAKHGFKEEFDDWPAKPKGWVPDWMDAVR
jgi:hypothetical protein